MIRALAGLLLGIVARLWLATMRVRVVIHPALEAHEGTPWVFAFFHGTQWPLLAWKRRKRTAVMVSHSNDGAMQARALSVLGFDIVRGSSSRGGARGLAALVRRIRGGADAAFAVDGPKGPYGVAKPGAMLAAKATGGILVPMGSAAARGRIFDRAWDRFLLAWPFTRAVVVIGPPLEASATSDEVSRAVWDANARAASELTEAGAKVLSSLQFSGVCKVD